MTMSTTPVCMSFFKHHGALGDGLIMAMNMEMIRKSPNDARESNGMR